MKFYTINSIDKPVPMMGSIWHVRDNEVLYDYADGQTSQADYGAALKSLFEGTGPTTLQAGDLVVTGPGNFDTDSVTISTSDIAWIASGTVIEPTSSDYSAVLDVTGDNVLLDGITVRGAPSVPNNDGDAFKVQGDQVVIRRCRAFDMVGGPVSADGIGFKMANCSDAVLDSCYAEGCQYVAVRASDANRLTVINCYWYNCGIGTSPSQLRTMVFDGTANLDWVRILDTESIADIATAGAFININTSGFIDQVLIRGVSFVDAVARNTANREQQLKVQNVAKLIVEGCTFKSLDNVGTGNMTSIAVDSPFPTDILVRYCWFSGGCLEFYNSRIEKLTYEHCSFGNDYESYGFLIGIPPGQISLIDCIGNLGTTAERFCDTTGTTVDPTDYVRFERIKLTGNNAATLELNRGTNFVTYPRKITCLDPTLTNDGAGTFVRSDNDTANLLLNTDASGNLLFDDSAVGAGMPAPGSDPWFTGTPGSFVGQKIFNINYNNDETSTTPEKEWTWNGSTWELSYVGI